MPAKGGGEVTEADVLPDRLRGVYWIGGGSGAGKSTVAHQLAARHGFHVFGTDEHMPGHVVRMAADDNPRTTAFVAMDVDERWVNRSPEEMLETFHWFRGEGFGSIIEDLLAVPKPAIAEGFRLLPRLVSPLLIDRHHAVWLLPTPELRRVAFESRRPSGAPWAFVEEASDPDRALSNLLERDRLFTERLVDETAQLGLRAIHIDASMSIGDVVEQVSNWFRLNEGFDEFRL